jgi:AcrR family transcriptional regulator
MIFHTSGMDVKSKKALRSERTRAALVRSATRLLAERGYDGTLIDDVARRARVTKGALYHQFRDKRDLFEAVLERLVTDLVHNAKERSKQEMRRLGVSSKAPPRYVVGLDILLDGLCDPAVRRVVLTDGPVVLGRERWQALWGERMLELVRGVFRDSFRRGDIKPELVEPLAHLLFGALQETALAIGHADDPERARADFGAAARWMLENLLRGPDRDPPGPGHAS